MSRLRWTITECERCSRDNTRCILRAGEWVCTICTPEPIPAEHAGQLTLGDDQEPTTGPTEEIPY